MTDANTGDLELLVLVLYKTEVYNKLLYALNDAGIHGATTVSSSGMAHALADAEDSHIIAAFRAFAASDRRESKTIFMVIEKAKRDNTSFVQAFVTSKKLLIVVRTVFSTLPKSKNSPVML